MYRHSEHGGATLTLTIILSVAISILSGFMFFNTRGMQTVINSHAAQFHAKSLSWSGVSAFREYLHSLTQAEFDAFRTLTELDISIQELGVNLQVTDITVEDIGSITGDYQINGKIQDISNNQAASRPLEFVMILDAPQPPLPAGSSLPPGTIEPNSLYFGGDIDITGDQVIQLAGTDPGKIITAGNITFTNSTFLGLTEVFAGGDVWLESANTAEYIHADGNVTITGGAVVDQVRALGDVALRISGFAREIRANGSVTLDGQGTEFVSAQGIIYGGDPGRAAAPRGNHNYLESNSDILVQANIREVGVLYTPANAIVGANELDRVQDISVGGTLDCRTTVPRFNIGFANVGGARLGCPRAPSGVPATRRAAGAGALPVPPRSELTLGVTPTGINLPTFDVKPLKAQANYVVRITHAGGTDVNVEVDVLNVNGINPTSVPDTYTLGKISPAPVTDFADALCKTVSGEDCLDDQSTPSAVFCYGPNWQKGTNSRIRSCFQWDTAENKPVLRGRYMLPGIVYFESDLIIERSDHTPTTPDHSAENSFRNTILVEGDIIVRSNGSVTAVNHAGYNEICEFSFWDNNVPRQNFYPTNLCNMSTRALIYNNTGNIAIGNGNLGADGTTYSGGDILLESQGTLFGSVIAGDRFQCTGNRIITGMVSGLALTRGDDRHNINGECRFGVDLASGTLDPIDLPFTMPDSTTGGDTTDPGQGTGGAGTTPAGAPTMENARVLWSRFN